jgi:hypothetical protein
MDRPTEYCPASSPVGETKWAMAPRPDVSLAVRSFGGHNLQPCGAAGGDIGLTLNATSALVSRAPRPQSAASGESAGRRRGLSAV